MLAGYAKYLCVLVSGLLERSVETLLYDYALRTAAPQVSEYVSSTLQRVGIIDEESLLALIGRFSEDWKAELRDFLTPERSSALNSIRGNRNNIAHGRDSSLTYHDISNYYESAKETIRYLEALLK